MYFEFMLTIYFPLFNKYNHYLLNYRWKKYSKERFNFTRSLTHVSIETAGLSEKKHVRERKIAFLLREFESKVHKNTSRDVTFNLFIYLQQQKKTDEG